MTDTATDPAHHHGEPDEPSSELTRLDKQLARAMDDVETLLSRRRQILISQADFSPASH